MSLIIVIQKETNSKVAIDPRDFNRKHYAHLDEGWTPEPKVEASFDVKTASLAELRTKVFELSGMMPTGALRDNKLMLQARVEQLIKELNAGKEMLDNGLVANSQLIVEKKMKDQLPDEIVIEDAPEGHSEKFFEVLKQIENGMSQAECEIEINNLLLFYQELYGKEPVGKWAKDKEWLIKKINERKS